MIDGDSNKYVLVKKSGSALILTLNNLGKKNALALELVDELIDELRRAARDDEVRAVILTGQGDTFSTGADLNQASDIRNPLDAYLYFENLRALTSAVERLPKPVVAMINGYCVTGGLELAMACDVRIAEANARFVITSAKIGSLPGAGGTQRLPRLVGPAVAKDMLMTGRWLDSDDALRFGLVNQVCPSGEGLAAAEQWVEECTAMAPLSVWLAKWAVNTGLNLDQDSALDFETALSSMIFATEDKLEGMRAFLEKRPAHWKGR